MLLAELHVNLPSDQLSVLANLQIVLIGYWNISEIPYWYITNYHIDLINEILLYHKMPFESYNNKVFHLNIAHP